MTDSSGIGQRLRVLRVKAGLTVEELSKLVGISAGTIHRIESGTRTGMMVATAMQLSKALGSSIEWLAVGTGREPSIDDVMAAVTQATTDRKGQ